MSDFENMDVILGNYSRTELESHQDEIGKWTLGQMGLQQKANLFGDLYLTRIVERIVKLRLRLLG